MSQVTSLFLLKHLEDESRKIDERFFIFGDISAIFVLEQGDIPWSISIQQFHFRNMTWIHFNPTVNIVISCFISEI
jgi:UDP-2,3-diacylglucosamine pyrophosphatase LpxH